MYGCSTCRSNLIVWSRILSNTITSSCLKKKPKKHSGIYPDTQVPMWKYFLNVLHIDISVKHVKSHLRIRLIFARLNVLRVEKEMICTFGSSPNWANWTSFNKLRAVLMMSLHFLGVSSTFPARKRQQAPVTCSSIKHVIKSTMCPSLRNKNHKNNSELYLHIGGTAWRSGTCKIDGNIWCQLLGYHSVW